MTVDEVMEEFRRQVAAGVRVTGGTLGRGLNADARRVRKHLATAVAAGRLKKDGIRYYLPEQPVTGPARSECAERVLDVLREAEHALTACEIVRRARRPRATVYQALQELQKQAVVASAGRRGSRTYGLASEGVPLCRMEQRADRLLALLYEREGQKHTLWELSRLLDIPVYAVQLAGATLEQDGFIRRNPYYAVIKEGEKPAPREPKQSALRKKQERADKQADEALKYLHEEHPAPLTASHLADCLGIESNAASWALRRLVREGFATSERGTGARLYRLPNTEVAA